MNTSEVTYSQPGLKPPHHSSQYLYHLQNVSLHFGEIRALQNINLSVSHGEVLFVTGISGAGKSTLLRLLGGELKPTRGVIKRYQAQHSDQHFTSKVFQEGRLIETETAEDNILMSYDARLYSNRDEFIHDMLELAQYLGMKDQLNQKLNQSNGGLKQKVSMIRALMAKPSVILADEPTSSLDRANAFRVYELLNFYNSKNKMTVIWATHNRELVKQFTGKMIHLENGRVVYSGHACFI